MTKHHRPDHNGDYIDEHLIEHLATSDCSECVAAGRRLSGLAVPSRSQRIFLCDSLKGHWPVGGEAIVIAHSVEQARDLLQRQVELEGLPDQTVTIDQLKEIDCVTPRAIIINDGDY